MIKKIPCVALVLLSPLSAAAIDLAVQPLNVSDVNPMAIGFAAPANTAPALLKSGEWQVQLGLNMGNTLHIEQRAKTGEALEVDAESSRHELTLEYGLTEDWDVRLNIPMIDHGAGSLDSFIDDFHQNLGLPEGVRPSRAQDLYLVRYDINGQTLLNQQQATSGVGDVSLAFVRTVETDYEDLLSYGFRFKFATGDEQELTGSGSHGLSIWATAADQLSASWQHYASAGIVAQESDKGLLADQRSTAYGFARYGLAWRATELAEFKLQLDYQNGMYKKSDTRLLGHSVALAIGGTLHFANQWDLDIAVVEDADTDTTTDVLFHFNLRKRFGA